MQDVIEVTPEAETDTAPATPVAAKTAIEGVIDGGSPLDHALRYATERHWDVLPGTWLESDTGTLRCSCGNSDCPQPGAHPAKPRWTTEATNDATVVRRLWTQRPRAAVLLPTGRAFDAIDVPESAGCLAMVRIERLGLDPGPVVSLPDGRMVFLVQPGAEAAVPGMLRELGWAPGALDLATLSEGAWAVAPPTRFGGRGCVRWARRPSATNRSLPDVRTILAPLAYACGREAAAARGH